jgi:NRPS condensation-like uncharacterized protein
MTAQAQPRVDLRPRPPGPRLPQALPFAVGDELNYYFSSPGEPNNVHLEAWLPGRLNPGRLRAAVTAVLADTPRAAARRRPSGTWRTRDAWEFAARPDRDPVTEFQWRTVAELDAARARFVSSVPGLDSSPAFQLLLAQGPGWDSLILNAHHALFDGRSSLLLLEQIAARYSALSGPPGTDRRDLTGTGTGPAPVIHIGQLAPAPAAPGPAGAGRSGTGRFSTGRGQGRHAAPRLAGRRSARIARQHAAGHPATAPGYHLRLLDWPTVPVGAQRPGQPRVTVNDLLIAVLAETVNRWNSARLARPAFIRISMPMDSRSPGQNEMGNLSRLATVTVDPRRTGTLAETVAGQTRLAKAAPGPLVRPGQAAFTRTRLPVPVKRAVVRLALRWFGHLTCDTSLLSNLGICEPPAFGSLTPARLWFSGPAHMPRGLAVGAVSVGGRLQLCLRYRKALLDEAAGEAFAAEFAAALQAMSVNPMSVNPMSANTVPARAESRAS